MSDERPIRVLFVEDVPEDAELAAWAMRREGLHFESMRVETEEGFAAALREFRPDVIVSDYSMPQFDGMRALNQARAADGDIPFIVLTGSMNEETAVTCLKAGATDYVLKERMARLPFAVREALQRKETLQQKRAAERTLRAREAQYRLLADNMSDTIWLFDLRAGRLVYVSPSVKRLLGYSVEEAPGLGLEELLPSEPPGAAAGALITRVGAFAAGDESVRTQTARLLQTRKDGSRVSTEVVSTLVTDAGGGVNYIQGVARDIGDRVEAERTIRESEEKFSRAFMGSPVGVVISTLPEGRIIDANAAFCQAIGYEHDEIVGQTALALGVWAEPADRERAFAALHREGRVRDAEVVVRTKGGELRSLFFSVEPIDLGGEQCILTTALDVTDRKQAEARERESEARFQNLVESAPDGVFVSIGRNIEFVNEAMVRLLGASEPAEVIGTEIFQWVAPEYHEVVRERGRIMRAGGTAAPQLEEEYIRLDGSRVPVETRSVLTRFKGQEAYLVVVRDVFERRKAEADRTALQEQLQQAQKMESVGLLAGGVAHDFNNLLMVQKGYCELMRSDPDLDLRLVDGLTQIEVCVDRATALTRQLLAFGRRQTMQPVVLDLGELVRDLADMLQSLVGEGVGLSIHLDHEPALVKADRVQLEQVLVNLAANARDAMPEGGRLDMTVAPVEMDEAKAGLCVGMEPGSFIMLEVRDNGLGMDAETKRRVFEPFFTTKGEGKGTGLGLSTVYGIVQQSGGSIDLESERGVGTAFRVFLPRLEIAPRAAPRQEDRTVDGQGELILVVDDDPVLRELVRLMVESLGFRALVAPNPTEAAAMVAEGGLRPDLLLSDVVMPGTNGAALVEGLRKTMPELRVIFMSGYPDSAIARHRLADSTVFFLQKPFSISELGDKIKSVLASGMTTSGVREV